MIKKLMAIGGLVALLGCRPAAYDNKPAAKDRFEKTTISQLLADTDTVKGKYVSIVGKPVSHAIVNYSDGQCTGASLIIQDDNDVINGYATACSRDRVYRVAQAVSSAALAEKRDLKIEVYGVIVPADSWLMPGTLWICKVKAAGIETVIYSDDDCK